MLARFTLNDEEFTVEESDCTRVWELRNPEDEALYKFTKFDNQEGKVGLLMFYISERNEVGNPRLRDRNNLLTFAHFLLVLNMTRHYVSLSDVLLDRCRTWAEVICYGCRLLRVHYQY